MKYILIILIFIIFISIISTQLYCKNNKKSLIEILNKKWYEDVTKFPYNDFKCEINCDEYNKTIKEGYDKMKNTRIIFCGLCINIENNVTNLKRRFEHLGQYFKDYRVIIFENDSKDNTRELLKKICLDNNKFILLECEDAKDCKYNNVIAKDYGIFNSKRMYKMITYRNKLLNYIKNNYNHFDIVCMIDLDITGPISIDGIAHSFGKYNNWDSITANGISGITFTLGQQYYYDLIAYKDNNLDINNNIFDIISIFYKLNTIKIGQELLKVKSAFGGMELIKMYIINNNINYTPIDNNYKCEHIIFHENMIRNNYSNIYINPSMIILVGLQGNEKYLYVY